MTHLDLNDSQVDVLSGLYAESNCTLDDLLYSDEFERLNSQLLARVGVSLERHYVCKALCIARKASKLVCKDVVRGQSCFI
jgi:arylsulfatase A-like enzyme